MFNYWILNIYVFVFFIVFPVIFEKSAVKKIYIVKQIFEIFSKHERKEKDVYCHYLYDQIYLLCNIVGSLYCGNFIQCLLHWIYFQTMF